MFAWRSKLINCQLQMSLRGLYRYLHQKSQTYLVHDGRHVFMHWRRADQVHALAQEYLTAKMPGFGSSHVRATHACQDLMELKLLRCAENNEPRRWVNRDISFGLIWITTVNLRRILTSGVSELSATPATALFISLTLSHGEEQINSSVLVYDGRKVLCIVFREAQSGFGHFHGCTISFVIDFQATECT